MTHQTFIYDKPLTSTKVTKDSLEALEHYLTKRAIDSGFLSKPESEKAIEIQITDRLGTEKLSSIEQMTSSRFADGTSRIQIELSLPYREDGTRFSVRASFTTMRLLSDLRISATMPNARDIVLAWREGIMRSLEPQRTWNWLFHPRAEIVGALFGGCAVLAFSLFKSAGKGPYSMYLLGILVGTAIYMLVPRAFRPYTVFDSRAADRSEKLWNWLMAGAASFVVFGTLFQEARKALLGF